MASYRTTWEHGWAAAVASSLSVCRVCPPLDRHENKCTGGFEKKIIPVQYIKYICRKALQSHRRCEAKTVDKNTHSLELPATASRRQHCILLVSLLGASLPVLRACPQDRHDPADLSISLKIRVNKQKFNHTPATPEELHPVKAVGEFVGTLAQ